MFVYVGIDAISMDMKGKNLTIIGSVDPVSAVSKLRKFWKTDIVSVGPAKEPEKKEEPKKEEPKKEETKEEPKKEEAKKEETKEEAKKEEAKKEEEPKKEGEAKKEEVAKKIEAAEPVVGMIMPYRPPYYAPNYAPMSTYYPSGPPMKAYYPPTNTSYYAHHHSMEENPNACVIC